MIALSLMMPILTVFSDAIGVMGGYWVARVRFGQPASMYIENAQMMVGMTDLFSGLTKTFFFGLIISSVSCYKGFNTSGGAEGVGKATTSAVVVSSITVLVADYFLTAAMSVF
jgi:phospholipid/cholesterol/gamma-HCH transport system permease protein